MKAIINMKKLSQIVRLIILFGLLSVSTGSIASCYDGNNINDCIREAQQGNTYSQYLLGYSYHTGRDVEQNYVKAAMWYRMAAVEGVPEAQNNLGLLYDSGQGVEQDYYEAVRWFRLAAEQGFDRGQHNLADAYYTGLGVRKNWGEALKWYRRAAAQGNEQSINNARVLQKMMNK